MRHYLLASAVVVVTCLSIVSCEESVSKIKKQNEVVKKLDLKREDRVKGYIDMHAHLTSHRGFGGKVFFGEPMREEGAPDEFRSCEEVHGVNGKEDLAGNIIFRGFAKEHGTDMYAENDSWPSRKNQNHQQAHIDWLKRSYKAGLRLVVSHAVNNMFACELAGSSAEECDDMLTVEDQLKYLEKMEAKIAKDDDGWFKIVRSSKEARQAIKAGKLAVVMGVEVDTVFDCKMKKCDPQVVRKQLKKYKEIGLRHVFPVHLFNNGFGGTSYFNQFLVSASATINNHKPLLGKCAKGYEGVNIKGKTYCSPLGLSDHGSWFVELLMQEQMIIDVDHMSRIAFQDTLRIAERNNYPLVSSHSGVRGMYDSQKFGEDKKTDDEILRIYKLGGMMAPILAARDTGSIKTISGIEHNCSHAATGWAAAYNHVRELLKENKVAGAIGLGSDFNGMINLPSGRFGPKGCNGNKAEVAYQDEASMIKYPFVSLSGQLIESPYNYLDVSSQQRGNRIFDYNFEGLSHVGMMPEFFEDLKKVGMEDDDFEPFMNSAEAFIQMWEKIESTEVKLSRKSPNYKYTLKETVEKIDTSPDEIRVNQDFELQCPKEMACSTVRKNKISVKDGKNFVKYFLSSGLGDPLKKVVCNEEISISQGLSGDFCYCKCHRYKDEGRKDKNQSSDVTKTKLATKKGISAETVVSIDVSRGYISLDTKAKVAFYTHKDKREFYLDQKLLLSEEIRNLDVGDEFSLDKRVEFPRYKAILRSVTGDIADIAIVDSQKVIDIDVLADLRGEVIKFTEAKIYLRKALGGITLEVEEVK